jgi:hypothetical protein
MGRRREPTERAGGARSRLLAAGIAASQISLPDTDPRFQLFNPAVVDRLHEPISRCRE